MATGHLPIIEDLGRSGYASLTGAGGGAHGLLATRRQVLQGVGMMAVSLTFGGIANAYAADSYDVVIVGAGTAGIPLALAVSERGGRALVIEKSGQIGGTLHLSGGHVAAGGTRLQKRKGIADSPEEYYADIMRLSHNRAEKDLARLLSINAPSTLDWLEDLGFQAKPTDPVKGEDHAHFSVARYLQGPERGVSILRVLLPPFQQAVTGGRVRLLLWTGAVELVIGPDKSVVGLIAEDANGIRRQFSASNIVLTTGGYCSNPEYFTQLTGKVNYSRWAYPYSQGDGIKIGVAAGGFVRGASYQVLEDRILSDRNYPTPYSGVAVATNPDSRLPWEILVNSLGQRFVAEDDPDLDVHQRAFTQQAVQRAWLVFDDAILTKAPTLFTGKSEQEIASLFTLHPMFAKASTLDELAQLMRLPPSALASTVADYNRAVRSGEDKLGRKYLPVPIERGPFYAIELSGTANVGHAGLAIDRNFRVMRTDGTAVGNLYAVGEVTGHATLSGDTLVSGSGVTPALTFGRLLGQQLLRLKT